MPYGDPRGVVVSYERGTPVIHTFSSPKPAETLNMMSQLAMNSTAQVVFRLEKVSTHERPAPHSFQLRDTEYTMQSGPKTVYEHFELKLCRTH